MRKIRWGVLGTANIGVKQVIPAMQRGQYCDIVAIASRRLESAQTVAARLGIPKAYGSYESLLADPEIEAIYNPLPNHLHVPWSIRALEAGKNVLCEKPIATSAAEAQTLLDVARRFPQLKVMEAFMYRHHPQWQRARELVQGGGIGELRTVQSFFSYYLTDPQNVRNRADIGGGGLLDIGSYCISWSRFLFAAEPLRVCAVVEYDPQLKIDRLASGILDFGRGTATFTCATQLPPFQRVLACGSAARLEISTPCTAPADRAARIWRHCAAQSEEITFDPCNQYGIQGDLFSLAILNDTPVFTPLEDAVANMKVIEAVSESAKRGGWVAPA